MDALLSSLPMMLVLGGVSLTMLVVLMKAAVELDDGMGKGILLICVLGGLACVGWLLQAQLL